MRYNSNIQMLADECAKSNGKFAAIYQGRIPNDTFVFIPVYSDNELRCEGLPQYILVHDGEAIYDVSLSYFEYRAQITSIYFPRRGKEIFECYRKMCEHDCFPCKKDEAKIREIVQMSWGGGYNHPVRLRDIYEFLEIAVRFRMTIEFYPDPSTTDRCDGWNFFIKVVRGHLPAPVRMIID